LPASKTQGVATKQKYAQKSGRKKKIGPFSDGIISDKQLFSPVLFIYPRLLKCLLLLLLAAASGLLLRGEGALAFDAERLRSAFTRYRADSLQPLYDWQAMLQASHSATLNDQLRLVNEFFNRRVHFSEDQHAWGRGDYWATPLETLAKGAGDCEDFAIAKYFSLMMLGVPAEKMRLVYVKARIGGPSSRIQQAHMVLAFYATPDAEPQVLDNLITDIRPASGRSDLQPIFSFNSNGVYPGANGNATAGPGGTSRLSKWQDLLQRARIDGFGQH
jgi:predicted transglutaminase-like cysteine proteinase